MSRQQILEKLPANLKPPTNCPTCGTKLTLDDAWPYCPNFSCPNRIYGRIQKFVDVLDIKGAGIETLRALVDLGVKTPADLFNITEQEFCNIDRKGDKHYAKFQQGLDSVKKLRVAQIFAALDIEGIGTWEAICSVPGLQSPDQIMQAVKEDRAFLFANATRVSVEKANKIISEIKNRWSEVTALLEKIKVKETGAKLIGKTFCLTGSLSVPRPKIEELIKENGGQVSSSVTSRTTHLITDTPDSSSSKNKKARQLGTKIINETQFREMLK
jgi:DNA ligase (NAD+)